MLKSHSCFLIPYAYIIRDKIAISQLCGLNFYNIKLFLELTKFIKGKG